MNKMLRLAVPAVQAAPTANPIFRTAYYTLAVRAWNARAHARHPRRRAEYLTHAQRVALLPVLKQCFPNHVVCCDLMRKSFFESYSRDIHERIVGLGTSFSDMSERPEELFMEAGYAAAACASIPLRAAERGVLSIPAFAMRWLLGKLHRGYCIWKLEFAGASTGYTAPANH